MDNYYLYRQYLDTLEIGGDKYRELLNKWTELFDLKKPEDIAKPLFDDMPMLQHALFLDDKVGKFLRRKFLIKPDNFGVQVQVVHGYVNYYVLHFSDRFYNCNVSELKAKIIQCLGYSRKMGCRGLQELVINNEYWRYLEYEDPLVWVYLFGGKDEIELVRRGFLYPSFKYEDDQEGFEMRVNQVLQVIDRIVI